MEPINVKNVIKLIAIYVFSYLNPKLYWQIHLQYVSNVRMVIIWIQ